MTTLDWASILFVVVCVVAFVSALATARAKAADRDAARVAYFAARYGTSVDRMLAECPLDRDPLRAVRDSGRSGPVKAARQLLRTEPVPLAAAAEFIKRL